jgi:hypothetical protein
MIIIISIYLTTSSHESQVYGYGIIPRIANKFRLGYEITKLAHVLYFEDEL